ncbi:MAG: PAS domain S-box protein [Clostridiales bacterium]|nr:PAS domain S-box protein [Clostridiales bacterium]MCF8022142.1 PAS domain S-box protein [Clostridiales bacterium]
MNFAQEKYRLLVENLPEGFAYHQIVTDIKGNPVDYIILEVNSAFEKMTGLLRDQVIGRKATEVYPGIEESKLDLIGIYGKVALTGETAHLEQYFEEADCWCDITAYSGEQGFFAVIYRDITAVKSLRESEEKYRELVENLNEIIYILDENAKVKYISPNVESISGYTPDELAKMRFTDFVHPEDIKGRINQFQKIMSGVNEATEYRFVTRDGGTVWVRTAARPVVREGRVVGVQGVLTDITERKQAEEKLRYISFHDVLTGLYNRFYLEEKMKSLDTEMQIPISIIMADVNNLKLVNDTYGHSAGDEMLKQAAEILTVSCREDDIVVRWGGDEFIILLLQTSEKELNRICKKINEKCCCTYVKDVPNSIALGCAIMESAKIDLREIFKEAEDDMYKQKWESKVKRMQI